MIDTSFAARFAADWIDTWNCHDIERILSHYADDFRMSSPYVAQMAGEPSGTLQGKAAVREYWEHTLRKIPDLHFGLVHVLTGVDSLVIYYNGVRGPAAEVFHFDATGKVIRACAHYV